MNSPLFIIIIFFFVIKVIETAIMGLIKKTKEAVKKVSGSLFVFLK